MKQSCITEFFPSKCKRQTLESIKNTANVSVASCSQNGQKRKKSRSSKNAYKHSKSNKSVSDNVNSVEIVSQKSITLNCEEGHRDKKKNIEQSISLSQSSTSSVSSAASVECTIVYESFNRLSQEDLDATRLLVEEDNNITNENIDLLFEEDYDISSVNQLRKDMLNNETLLERAENEMEYNNGYLKKTPVKEQAIFKENTSPNTNTSSSSSIKSNYSMKMSSGKSPKKQVTEKLFDQFVNIDIARTVIEHMNLAKQGAILQNNFNLEEIYSTNAFDYHYGQINTTTSVNYQLDKVNLPVDLNAKILIASIFAVLSKPFNCGYFDGEELDFLYSVLTLPEKGQMLMARMIKRMRGWHRIHKINYPEISSNLKDVFHLLESQLICKSDVKDESLPIILDLLQAKELQQLCKSMKINHKGRKDVVIAKLTKLSKVKPLYPGMRTPSTALYDCIYDILDYCVHLTDRTWNVIEAIITLLLPNEYPKSSMSDIFYKLGDIYLGKTKFPSVPENEFPIFSCRLHLITYVNIKSILSRTLNLIKNGNWEEVRSYGNLAMETLPNLLETEFPRLKNCMLPMHVRKFMCGYIWLKILSKSIVAFKREKDKKKVVEILNFLIEQKCHMQTYKGQWYCELALVEMHHHKNLDFSALIITEALKCEHLSQVDIVDLLQRAKMISKRQTGIDPKTKMNINNVLDNYCHQIPTFDTKIEIFSTKVSKSAQSVKSTWLVKSNDNSDDYGSVETVALYYYKEQQNFSNGLHCEGKLPILLFTTLFWEELYERQVPGAFAAPFETAPADLFTKHFYEHRKQYIDAKLYNIESFASNPASFSTWMETRFDTYKQYLSIMPGDLLNHSIFMKEIVYCLGVPAVTGICKRMLENFRLWSAGFPDLIVWNYGTRQHKIVEVKGPGDVLSTKQQLWLAYLNELGLNVEICKVQDKKARKNIDRLEDNE